MQIQAFTQRQVQYISRETDICWHVKYFKISFEDVRNILHVKRVSPCDFIGEYFILSWFHSFA